MHKYNILIVVAGNKHNVYLGKDCTPISKFSKTDVDK